MNGRIWLAVLALATTGAEAQYLSTAVCEAEDTPPALCEMAQRLFNPNRFYFDPRMHNGSARLRHVQLRRGWMNDEGGWTISHVPLGLWRSLHAQFLRREPEPFVRDGEEHYLWGFEVALRHNRRDDYYDYDWRDIRDAGRYEVLVNAIYDPEPNDEFGSWRSRPYFGRVGNATWATGQALYVGAESPHASWDPWLTPAAARAAIHRLLDRCLARSEVRIALALLEYPETEWCDPDG